MRDTKKDDRAGTVMIASALIIMPTFAWAVGLVHHFVVVPYSLGEWFTVPMTVTGTCICIFAWCVLCEVIDKFWSSRAGDENDAR